MDSRFISHGQTTACEPKCCTCPRGTVSHRAECPAGAGNVDTTCTRVHRYISPDPTAIMDSDALMAEYGAGRIDGYVDAVEGSPSASEDLTGFTSAYRAGYTDGAYAARVQVSA